MKYRILSRHEFILRFGGLDSIHLIIATWNSNGKMNYLFGKELEAFETPKVGSQVRIINLNKDASNSYWYIEYKHIIRLTELSRFIVTKDCFLHITPEFQEFDSHVSLKKGEVFEKHYIESFMLGSDIIYIRKENQNRLAIPFTARLLNRWEEGNYIKRF
jgi:hypothetical protein